MKRVGNLYHKIYSLENLQKADKKASKGKSKQKEVIIHRQNSKSNILKLQENLIKGTFKTSKYNTFTILEKKERVINSLPYYPDRILQHAVLQVSSSIFIKCFISQTYSCIPKRGVHKCLKDVRKALIDSDNTLYTLKLDIKKFYYNINKELLKVLLNRKFKDKKFLKLLFEIIDSHKNGIPIGSYLSQFFGNFYLTTFDRWLKQILRIKYYFRYMDDMVILHSSKYYLYNLKLKIIRFLKEKLFLKLGNYQVFPTKDRGIDFVGYRIYPDYVLLRKSIKNNFITMVKYNKNNASIASYNGWLKWCNSYNLQTKYLNN